MKVVINGQEKQLQSVDNLLDVVEALDIQATRFAVECNGEIVSKDSLGEVSVTEGDIIEVVAAIGGG